MIGSTKMAILGSNIFCCVSGWTEEAMALYPDYIVKMKDGTIWVIETKGGESHGASKNIDVQIGNKFNAFKEYAAKHDIKWGCA